jgi:hypothetical protein
MRREHACDDQLGGHFEDYLIGLREAAGVAGSAATVRIAEAATQLEIELD